MRLAAKIVEDLRDFSSVVGDGLEVEAAVTAYGFVVCSLSHGDDYQEFDVSDVQRFPGAIDEFVAEMPPVPAAPVPA